MTVRLLTGHVLDRLRDLADESVHCVVTSPPYLGLRDYKIEPQVWPDGWRGSLGLEPTSALYIEHMAEVFREVRRVMRQDATCWVNLGDGFANKQLLMMPSRVALALQADGWWVRSNIRWCKKAPMPESATDRPTSAVEDVFLLTKSARYFYDAEAVKEDAIADHGAGNAFTTYHKKIIANSPLTGGTGPQEPWNDVGGKRNMRNFWLLGPSPYPEAHFATFPPRVPEICILAGTSERGCCPKCLAPWVRQIKRSGGVNKARKLTPKHALKERLGIIHGGQESAALSRPGWRDDPVAETETIGWRPTCSCDAGKPTPATILDPFFGAGTTGLVADRLGRNCIGIELNQGYAEMAERRIRRDAGMFADVVVDQKFLPAAE